MPEQLHDSLIFRADRHAMFPEGATVLVAVSGGQDSCALLHALVQAADRWRLKLHAAHFNHRLRGQESDTDAQFVAELCEKLGVPATLGEGDVAGAAKRTHRSKQVAARDLRHRFLEQAAAEAGAQRIALAHTRDDRLETVLLNIIRGTGIDGLQGIAPISGNRVRPLIDVPREETRAYCLKNQIDFRADPSNERPVYLRNRVRSELLPLLAAYYNPAIRDALARLSELAVDDAEFLDLEARKRLAGAAANIEHDRVVLSLQAMREEPRAVRRRLVRLAVERVRGSLADVDFSMTETVLGALDAVPGTPRFQLTLPGGDTRVGMRAGKLVVERLQPPISAVPVLGVLAVPGVTRIEPWGIEIAIEEANPEGYEISDRMAAVIDRSVVRGTLVVRNRRPGDRLQPIGMDGTRKLQDVLTDRKVPREQRDRVAVVADDEGILWVAGHALADRAKVTDETTRALRMSIRRTEPATG